MVDVQVARGASTTDNRKGSVRRMTTGAKDGRGARASRFALQVGMRYRATGEGPWHNGENLNVSSSGTLFHVERTVVQNALLDLRLRIPVTSAEGAVEMLCRGILIRAAGDLGADGNAPVATEFLHCRRDRP